MKLLSLILIGCLFLAQLAQAQPEVGDPTLVGDSQRTGNNVGRIELHYSGERAYERSGVNRCIPVQRGKQTLDGLFFSHPTKCVVYTDRQCTKKAKLYPFIYKPGYYKPAVDKGFGFCKTIRN